MNELISTYLNDIILYPEWPHRQCVGLAFRWSRVRVPVGAASLVILWPALAPCNMWSSGSTALCRLGSNSQSIGSTVSEDIVGSCRGRLQLGVPR